MNMYFQGSHMGGGKGLESNLTPEKDGKAITLHESSGYDYDGYSDHGGFLNREDYRKVLSCAREYKRKGYASVDAGESAGTDGQEKNPKSVVYKILKHIDKARQLTRTDQQEVLIFQALKDFFRENPDAEAKYARHNARGEAIRITDEQILADAYRMLGDPMSLDNLDCLLKKDEHRHIVK